MKSFTFSDMNRQSGDILETALKGPVKLTKHGKEKLVILPASLFKTLEQGRNSAFTVENAPALIHDELMAGLDDIITGGPIDA
jgi:prevent-host-death family protein